MDRTGQCAKRFPKPLQETLAFDEVTGFPLYQRLREEDRHVVPHVRDLLLFWGGHINVEYCASSLMPVYLYKYLFKGPDSTRYNIVDPDRSNEIATYVKARYISAMEATWFVLGHTTFPPSYPPVQQLSLVMAKASNSRPGSSPLAKYLNRPNKAEYDHLRYHEFFERYQISCYRPRNAQNDEFHVGTRTYYCYRHVQQPVRFYRIVSVFPSTGEQFYLRLLLLHRPGRSFAELKTINGRTVESFQQAAKELGLIEDADETYQTLQDAIGGTSPAGLRKMFACLTLHGFPTASIFYDNAEDNAVMR